MDMVKSGKEDFESIIEISFQHDTDMAGYLAKNNKNIICRVVNCDKNEL